MRSCRQSVGRSVSESGRQSVSQSVSQSLSHACLLSCTALYEFMHLWTRETAFVKSSKLTFMSWIHDFLHSCVHALHFFILCSHALMHCFYAFMHWNHGFLQSLIHALHSWFQSSIHALQSCFLAFTHSCHCSREFLHSCNCLAEVLHSCIAFMNSRVRAFMDCIYRVLRIRISLLFLAFMHLCIAFMNSCILAFTHCILWILLFQRGRAQRWVVILGKDHNGIDLSRILEAVGL